MADKARQGLDRYGALRRDKAWQVRLVLVRPVALRFVGNGQGKAGEAGLAWKVGVRSGEAGWGEIRQGRLGRLRLVMLWQRRDGQGRFGMERQAC